MLQMVTRIILLIIALGVSSCNSFELKGLLFPTGEGVDKRFGQSMEMNDDLKYGTVAVPANYSFYVAADPHINETHTNLKIFNDALRNDAEASFGIILGDCIEVKGNLPKYLEALEYNPDRHSCDYTIYHVLGNHDLYFKGWEDFRDMIGPSVYWFEAVFDGGKDLFISLDTATGSLGKKQTDWFKSFLSSNRADYRHCVILTHTNFYYTDNSQTGSGNMPIEETFSLIDFIGKHNVSLVLQGHDHHREDLTFNNVRYTIIGTIQDGAEAPEYLKINASKDEIVLDWQLIP